MNYIIYSITNPVTGEVVYVGKTTNFEKRKKYYLSGNSHNTLLAAIFEEMKNGGFIPIFNVLQEVQCSKEASFDVENSWIEEFRSPALCNHEKDKKYAQRRCDIHGVKLPPDIVRSLKLLGLDYGFKMFKPFAEYVLTKLATRATLVEIPLEYEAELKEIGHGDVSAGIVNILRRNKDLQAKVYKLQSEKKNTMSKN